MDIGTSSNAEKGKLSVQLEQPLTSSLLPLFDRLASVFVVFGQLLSHLSKLFLFLYIFALALSAVEDWFDNRVDKKTHAGAGRPGTALALRSR